MFRYRYKAIDQNGKTVNGKMSAENPAELLTMLRANSLELISYSQDKVGGGLFSKIKTADLISIFVHLEQLEKAGVSIIDSIADLKENADSIKVRNLMHEIYEAIKNGSLFSESLTKHPHVFNKIYIGLIAMGEKTGNLANAFASIIEDIKWNNDINRKTSKAIRGPMFGILIMFIVLGVMTSVVVPKVTAFLTAQSIDLPGMTVALIAFSDFMKNYWYIMIIIPIVFYIIIKILQTSEKLAIKIDDLKIKVPVFGPIIKKIDSAKFCQFFALTFRSGLGVLDCLESASGVIKNKAIKRSIIQVKDQVSDGQSMTKSISATGYFPSLVVRMFKVGEESGNMESALQNIKFFYDREINDSIDKIVGMIQPTITLVMGLMIAWITIAVFGPIYSTFSNIQ
ncbi:phytochrome sensor protein [Alphaproteobacteria bacterium]|nr:phytochrome sensor protein [Alphaproteobacteria bacterium]